MLYKGFRITDYMPTGLLLVLFTDEDQPREKRLAACIALGTKDDGPSYDALLAGLQHEDWHIRYVSLEAIKRHARVSDAEAAIIQCLFDVNDQVRQTACKVCAELGFTGAHDAILQLLETASRDVRDVALGALSRMWREGDFDRVYQIFMREEERSVRIAAAKVLRAHAGADNWRRLFRAWHDDREVRHRMWSCELVGRFGGRSERAHLEALRGDPNRNVRQAAERARALLADRV
ncbi:MAG: HEAT repeat domain-containing protein [Candidatus Hydrogenedentes bacterium]|nr:HEAT repeat domain-containing protein [Candidatus Hydrogenedentota bacterium]